LNPDVIVAGTMAGVLAAKKLTNTVPIVAETFGRSNWVRRGRELRAPRRQCDGRVADCRGLAD
jgi:hypothetical protein